jgi:hypothetical protein
MRTHDFGQSACHAVFLSDVGHRASRQAMSPSRRTPRRQDCD